MKTFFACLLFLFAISCQQGGKNNSAKTEALFNVNENPDSEFMQKAAEGGLFEVKLGQLAQAKAGSSDVKELGNMMVSDHSKANNELKSLAVKKGVMLPEILSNEKQKKYDELSDKTSLEFDKAYAELMVKDHKKDIDAFDHESKEGKDADVKNWATEKLATLNHHLEMAQQTESAVQNMKP